MAAAQPHKRFEQLSVLGIRDLTSIGHENSDIWGNTIAWIQFRRLARINEDVGFRSNDLIT